MTGVQTCALPISEGMDEELKALMPLGVDALRRGLLDDDMKVALNAADKMLRANGKYNHDENKGHETAEDVIGRALGVIQTQAATVKELTRTSRPKALDVEFEAVNEPLKIVNGSSG